MTIRNPMRPNRLVVMWRPPLTAPDRKHVAIGELVRDEAGKVNFQYLPSAELDAARALGFAGYPAFDLDDSRPRRDVIEIFARRLLSEKRGDYADYLREFALPDGYRPTPFDLLAYSQGVVPGDPFYFVDPLTDARPPFQFLCDVRGARHQDPPQRLTVGDALMLAAEPANPKDPNAVAFRTASGRVGYLSRVQSPAIGKLLAKGIRVTAIVHKVNGMPEDPSIKALVDVVGASEAAA